MARDVSAAMLAALAASPIRPVVFYEGEFSTGTLRLWSGIGTKSWDGQSWLGAGEMLGVEAIGESSNITAVGFSVRLSGNSQALMAANLGAARQGLPGKVWLGLLDADFALIADPALCFSGRLDVPDVVSGGQTATIGVKYESRLIDLDRARVRRSTHEDQQIEHPGDLGFQYGPALQGAQLPWGAALLRPDQVNPFNARLRQLSRGG